MHHMLPVASPRQDMTVLAGMTPELTATDTAAPVATS